MLSILLLVGCVVSLIALAGLIVGIIVMMQSNRRDSVSSAREEWMRSQEDQDEW
jgi:hypothetical protein